MENATIYNYARMCRENTPKKCTYCSLSSNNNGLGLVCGNLIKKHPDKANEIIIKWCKEHPIKTRQDKFLEMFPNAQKLKTGILSICPKIVDETLDINCCARPCSGCYKDYWLAEVDENGDA